MEKKEIKKYIEEFVADTVYKENGKFVIDIKEKLLDFISEELDKAREEGREEIRQLLRDRKQMQEYLKKHPKFYKGEEIPTATSNLLKQ
jgi:5,10-methenyltetrahydromethanopterin hydrogenase